MLAKPIVSSLVLADFPYESEVIVGSLESNGKVNMFAIFKFTGSSVQSSLYVKSVATVPSTQEAPVELDAPDIASPFAGYALERIWKVPFQLRLNCHIWLSLLVVAAQVTAEEFVST